MLRALRCVVALLLAGCTHATTSGGTCVLNSDCAETLVCAGGFCRPQCREDRDCAHGETCHASLPSSVCVPAGAPLPCSIPSDCGRGATCVASTCRRTCMTDAECAPGTCTMGACADPVRADPDAGSPVDAGPLTPVCADETPIVPTMHTFQFTYTPPTTTPNGPSCMPGRMRRYYRLHVAERAIVILQTSAPNGPDTMGWLTPDCGTTEFCAVSCGSILEMARAFEPGDHPFLVESAGPAFNISVITIPIPEGVPIDDLHSLASFDLTTTLRTGDATATTECGSTGPSHVWFYYSCLTTDAHQLHVSSCGSDPNVDVAVISDVNGTVTCGTPDTSCSSAAQLAVQPAATAVGPGILVMTASGHGASDTGMVHLTGAFD